MSASSGVSLPTGWRVANYRETSQANEAGQIVQGIAFTLMSPNNQGTTVFVPNTLLTSTDAVEASFNQRINALTAITG